MKVALWHIYLMGRMGFEKSLGYIIADATILPPVSRKYGSVLACDIIKKWTDDRLVRAKEAK